MSALVLPVEATLVFVIWRLRRAGRLNIRLASFLAGLAIFLFIFLAGTTNDSMKGESAIVGAIVGVVVAGLAMAIFVTARRNGSDTLPW